MKKLAKMMAVAIASVVLSTGSLSAVEIKKNRLEAGGLENQKRNASSQQRSSKKIVVYGNLLQYLNLCQEVFLEKSVKTCIYYSYTMS